jgi:hypothetical protein
MEAQEIVVANPNANVGANRDADLKPLPEGKRWHFFLSHQQRGADVHAALAKKELGALGYSSWIDTEQLNTKKGMEDGVKGSVCVLLFLFKGTLDRPYCRFELRLALAHGVPVVVLFESVHYLDTYVSVPDLQAAFDREELPADLRCIVDEADWSLVYRRQPQEHALMNIRLCQELEAAVAAASARPALTPVPDASGRADEVRAAYDQLDADLKKQRAVAARPIAAPSKSPVRLAPDEDTVSSSSSSPRLFLPSDPVCVRIYCKGAMIDFDPARLKGAVSRGLDRMVKEADIKIKKISEDDQPDAFSIFALFESGAKRCRIEVEINKDAYLSAAETTSTDSDTTAPTYSFKTEQKLADQTIKMLLVREIFHNQVTEDQIKVVWSEEASSFFVLIETTHIAARLLYHLVEIGDPTMQQLDICAVLYEGNCAGCDPMTIQEKLADLPKGSRILQGMQGEGFVVPKGAPVMSEAEFAELDAMYGHPLLSLSRHEHSLQVGVLRAGMMMPKEGRSPSSLWGMDFFFGSALHVESTLLG